MALIDSNKLLGYALIDADHQVFINQINALALASNAEFPALFQQFYQDTEQHFAQEKLLMQQTAYPGETDHVNEHQRVLAELKQFKTRVEKGSFTFVRSYINQQLPAWFLLHVTTMDAALVSHLSNHV